MTDPLTSQTLKRLDDDFDRTVTADILQTIIEPEQTTLTADGNTIIVKSPTSIGI